MTAKPDYSTISTWDAFCSLNKEWIDNNIHDAPYIVSHAEVYGLKMT